MRMFANLAGSKLTGVNYLGPAGVDWDPGKPESPVHEVEMAVLLSFEGRRVRIDWAQDKFDEGLSIQFDVGAPSEWSDRSVGASQYWEPQIDRSLSAVSVAWHRQASEAEEVVLGLVLGFEGGGHVAIALGEIQDHAIVYLPEELVVIFDAGMARSYLGFAAQSWLHRDLRI